MKPQMPDFLYFCESCNTCIYLKDTYKCTLCGNDYLETYDTQSLFSFIDPISAFVSIVEELHTFTSGTNPAFAELFGESGSEAAEIECEDQANDTGFDLESQSNDSNQEILGYLKSGCLDMLSITSATKKGICSICLKKYKKGRKGVVLKCNHFFHYRCVVGWLAMHSTCPNCRIPIDCN